MLPYLLMADISRWAHENAAQMPDRVSQLTRRLEHEFAVGDEAIKNLIGVGFVEMLPETPRGDAVLNLLGPMLRGVAHDMNLFEPWPEGTRPPDRHTDASLPSHARRGRNSMTFDGSRRLRVGRPARDVSAARSQAGSTRSEATLAATSTSRTSRSPYR